MAAFELFLSYIAELAACKALADTLSDSQAGIIAALRCHTCAKIHIRNLRAAQYAYAQQCGAPAIATEAARRLH